LSCWVVFVLPGTVKADPENDFFEARIRPLLEMHCLRCHEAKKQEAGLRLDSRAGWIVGGDSGSAIVPHEPDESLLIKAIRHAAPDLKMPAKKPKLSEADIADFVAWVERGAFDPRDAPNGPASPRMSLQDARSFWAFQPLKSPPAPAVEGSWVKTPIDAFVLAALQTRGLSPVGNADKRTLIRRAAFDLTGLPPTPDEISAFLADESETAFESLVDRLLDSSAYGERWGRHWLDVARYADTAGDGADYPVREASKYRDWVIHAFNSDKPFRDFVREQIAGDILAGTGPADQYASRVTATGFLAIGKRYGYSAVPAYQHLDFADVIDSLGRSLLGLSLGCARCHDHKYDPISAADYYAVYGILESTQWAFPGGEEQKRPAHFPTLLPPAEMAILDKVKSDELAVLDSEIAELKRQQSALRADFPEGGVDLRLEAQRPGKPPGKPWFSAGPIEVTAEAQSPFDHVHPKGKLGVRLGSGKRTDGLRYVFEGGLRAAPGKQMHATIDFRSVAGSTQSGAYRFYLGRGVVKSLAVECSVTATEFAIRDGTEWVRIREIIPGTWYTLRLSIDPATKTYSGIVGTADDLTVFKDRRTGPKWDGVIDCFICDGIGHVTGAACARDLDNLGLQETAFGAPGSGPILPRTDEPAATQELAELNATIKTKTSNRQAVANKLAYPMAYGVREGKPVNARLQKRGDPHRLGDEIPRRNLELLGGDPVESGSGRLDLADWLTRPSNPLPARVFVNRVWQWHFGSGLVATPSDFGSRGDAPTHPKLLDWLAAEFVASGGSLKSLHRLIMKSQIYQLTSSDNAANLAADPENRWHWRFSRRPLDAESIRDAMLAVSGRLDRSAPSPHPFPPVETWGFTIHKPFHAVYDSNHRSVYLMVQRNRRHPYLALFDAADPNQSIASRQPTTTPTQALFLMNSPFVHEQAEGLAERIIHAGVDDQARAIWAFETTHGTIPGDAVVDDAIAFVTAYREKSKDDGTAWAALARVLLTSNAFLYVD
jgi:hypothetical protein